MASSGHRCLFTVLLWILTSYFFSLRSEQRAGLHKSDDGFCWFSFQGIQIDGGFCRSGFSTKPLAAQTLDAQADNMRLCAPLRCKERRLSCSFPPVCRPTARSTRETFLKMKQHLFISMQRSHSSVFFHKLTSF